MMIQDANIENISFAGYPEASMEIVKTKPLKIPDLYEAFWMFMIGSVAGFFVETIWCLIKNGRIECRSSMIIGPFTAVYGLGALVLYIGKHLADKNRFHVFAFGTVAGTVIEYICSLLQETFLGSVSWDYSRGPFNIGGRVCLIYSVFWGLLAILWFIEIQPIFERIILKIPSGIYKPLTWGLAVFLVLDIVISIAAVARWGMRQDGFPATGIITSLLDSLFPNEFMARIYPNMLW